MNQHQSAADTFPVEKIRAMFPALQRPATAFSSTMRRAPRCRERLRRDQRTSARTHGAAGRALSAEHRGRRASRGARAASAPWSMPRTAEICFGMNATSFIRLISLAIGQTLGERNEIIVTDLDHEANVATWLALAPLGAVRWWRIREDGNLHLEDLGQLVSPRTRLLACPVASNALGTIVDVAAVRPIWCTPPGARSFSTASISGRMAAWTCRPSTATTWSAPDTRFSGPTWGFCGAATSCSSACPPSARISSRMRRPARSRQGLSSTRTSPAWMRQSAISPGSGARSRRSDGGAGTPRRHRSRECRQYSFTSAACRWKCSGCCTIARRACTAISDPAQVAGRVPTLAFNIEGVTPAAVTETMARAGIGIRDGHMYSPRLMQRLGLPLASGTIRASLVHYNTVAEIHRFGEALKAVIASWGERRPPDQAVILGLVPRICRGSPDCR